MQKKLITDKENGNFTTQPVAATWCTDPEFVDLPGLKRFCSIGRSLAYQLIENGDIESVSLRRHGKIKGKRLIVLSSVRKFLSKQSGDVDPRLRAKCKEANKESQLAKRQKAKQRAIGNGQ